MQICISLFYSYVRCNVNAFVVLPYSPYNIEKWPMKLMQIWADIYR